MPSPIEVDLAQTELMCRALISYHKGLVLAADQMKRQIDANESEAALLQKTMETFRNMIENGSDDDPKQEGERN